MKVTYLGPSGVTFSAIAFYKMARIFGIEGQIEGSEEALASRNDDIVPLVAEHGGYGVIAMDTKSTGRVDPPVNAFIGLLEEDFPDSRCPIGVMGAFGMKINFVLMAKTGVSLGNLKRVLAHPKARGACKSNLEKIGVTILDVESNGEAAKKVAQDPEFATDGALAPMEAVTKYDLQVLNPAFEDEEAITTFFLLGPRGQKTSVASTQQRALLVFSVKHVPGAFARALLPFGDNLVQMIHAHSLFVGNGHYDFAAEFELGADQSGNYATALATASEYMGRFISFGPFPVL